MALFVVRKLQIVFLIWKGTNSYTGDQIETIKVLADGIEKGKNTRHLRKFNKI